MSNTIEKLPLPQNEPVLTYSPLSVERQQVKEELDRRKSILIDIPMIINGKEVRTTQQIAIHPPHEHQHLLGHYHKGNSSHVNQAITAALAAHKTWRNTPWQDRATIFLKAAELLAGPYRAAINAATMLGQSKNVHQAEIDAACELIDFLRYNVSYMTDIYAIQPKSIPGITNTLEWRPLEGFVFALTPFNFTAIAGNLPSAPAIMGNTVVWKPAETQIYSAQVIMEVFQKAGLPDGVINLIFVEGPEAGEVIFNHPDFSGIHFTGSTGVFNHIWKTIGANATIYKNYPRIVGETGGKDFVIAHHSADAKEIAIALVRGAFEFQGQKCSAASRAYLPESLWPEIKNYMTQFLSEIKMGTPESFGNFINAVIDEKAFDKITSYIEQSKHDPAVTVIAGGHCDKSTGYFIEPTVLLTNDPKSVSMCEEIFGPVLTVYVYPDNDFEATLELLDHTSPYALTGAIFSKDKLAVEMASQKLIYAAGNFYINDKPTGAVVGQQPFGGSRASGTNDKAGSMINLLRWASPRTIKENHVSITDYKYPFMD